MGSPSLCARLVLVSYYRIEEKENEELRAQVQHLYEKQSQLKGSERSLTAQVEGLTTQNLVLQNRDPTVINDDGRSICSDQ